MGTATPAVAKSIPSGAKANLSAKRRYGRAVNAVAAFLNKALRVPEIYLHFGGTLRSADVVAVDAAGSGDVHAVEVKIMDVHSLSTKTILEAVEKLKLLPAHYKYLALPTHPAITRLSGSQTLFSNDGIGRVGALTVLESDDAPPAIELAVRAERFRVPQPELTKVEKLLSRSHPDIFVKV